MKLAFFLLALGVCINAASISVEVVEKFELPSVSALLVTELLEATFHLPADVAQAIGHLFRDVPISLAKEMIAFVVKVFGDITGGHLDALTTYMDQAIHIFKQVIVHINPKEVAILIVDEIIPAQWAAILEKLILTMGKRDLSEHVDNLVDAIIDWGTTAVENLVSSLVTGFFGLFGKRMAEKGVIVDAVVDTLIHELTQLTLGLFGSLFGKRAAKGDIIDTVVDVLIDAVVESLTNWTLGLLGGLFGKRSVEKGFFVSVLTTVAVTALGNLISGKRDLGEHVDNLIDAVIDWGTTAVENLVSSLVTGFFGLFGKRNEKGVIVDVLVNELIVKPLVGWMGNLFGKRAVKGDIIDTVVDVLIDAVVESLTNWTLGLLGGLFGKRSVEKGFFATVLTSVAVSLVTTGLTNLINGKRDLGEHVDNLVDAIIDWGTTAVENLVSSLVTGFFGLFGKRMAEKGVIVDAVVDTLIHELTQLTLGLFGSLFGKRQFPGF